MVYKGINGESTNFVNNLFSLKESDASITTRSTINRILKVPKHHLSVTKGNIRVRGPLYY